MAAMATPLTPRIIGRRSSLFTRVTLMFAHELQVPCDYEPIPDMTRLDAAAYAGNPALKLPILRLGDDTLFGAQNICRALAEKAGARGLAARITWPEDARSSLARNAHELLWNAMTAQVICVMGTQVGDLPAQHPFFAKTREGFEQSLRWLDAHADEVIAGLPPGRTTSLFEIALFCLIEHLATVRATLPVAGFTRLAAFTAHMATRPSAAATAYRFDQPPAKWR